MEEQKEEERRYTWPRVIRKTPKVSPRMRSTGGYCVLLFGADAGFWSIFVSYGHKTAELEFSERNTVLEVALKDEFEGDYPSSCFFRLLNDQGRRPYIDVSNLLSDWRISFMRYSFSALR